MKILLVLLLLVILAGCEDPIPPQHNADIIVTFTGIGGEQLYTHCYGDVGVINGDYYLVPKFYDCRMKQFEEDKK